jgi:TRAP-type C4-dicarboxylate transport system substrate-binding protein
VNRPLAVTVILAALMSLSACAAAPPTVPTEVADPLVLSLGTDDHPGDPASAEIQEFVKQVAALSGGTIIIEPVWHAAGDVADWDQAIARLAIDGDLDLALVPSRAWDELGVDSLRPLNTPFLIDSDDLVEAVIGGDLAQRLMSGLNGSGVEGMALWPEGLRHPFGYDAPLVAPADFQGARIRAATSRTVAQTFAALGAQTDDQEPNRYVHAGTESSFLLKPGGTATANITFFPKVAVLVGNDEALQKLDSGQRHVLEQAADATRDWAVLSLPDELAAASAFCDDGGSIVHARPEDVAALVVATAGVRSDIAADPGGAETIAEIEHLKRRFPAFVAPECANP